MPQAEVKRVVLKVVAEDGDVAAAEQAAAGEEDDVIRVPAAVLEEVLREVAGEQAAAQQGSERSVGDVAKAPAVGAVTGQEGNQVASSMEGLKGCSVEAELLQLAGGGTFPGTEGPDGKPLDKLLLRKCHRGIVDRCVKLPEVYTWRALVVGTTGGLA